MARRKECSVCEDGLGFFARPCPGKCGKQKPLTGKLAEIYRMEVGVTLSRANLNDHLRGRYPNKLVK